MAATTIPTTVTPSNATNLRTKNKSPIRVPNLVDIELKIVTSIKAANATPLLTQTLTSAASAPTAARTMYSPSIIAMIAAEPGLSTRTAHQVKRKPARSPKIFVRYTWAPPLSGIAPPNSAKLAAPVQANTPATAHTTRDAPGDPALMLT